jgi:hypothetical protein
MQWEKDVRKTSNPKDIRLSDWAIVLHEGYTFVEEEKNTTGN